MNIDPVTRSEMPVALIRALWTATALGVMIGVGAAIGRTAFPDSFVTRSEPVREWLMDAFHLTDPFALERPVELALVDGKFGAHPFLTLLHVLPGAAFLLLAPLQFSAWVRRHHLNVHRWAGRVLLAAALVSVVPGLYFGIRKPYGGSAEAVAIALFGGLLLLAIYRGFVAIRRRQVARHREWMIRVFAIAIGISTVRIVAVPLDGMLTSAGVRPRDIFAVSVWVGWLLTVTVAESWIRYTRSRRASPRRTQPELCVDGVNLSV